MYKTLQITTQSFLTNLNELTSTNIETSTEKALNILADNMLDIGISVTKHNKLIKTQSDKIIAKLICTIDIINDIKCYIYTNRNVWNTNYKNFIFYVYSKSEPTISEKNDTNFLEVSGDNVISFMVVPANTRSSNPDRVEEINNFNKKYRIFNNDDNMCVIYYGGIEKWTPVTNLVEGTSISFSKFKITNNVTKVENYATKYGTINNNFLDENFLSRYINQPNYKLSFMPSDGDKCFTINAFIYLYNGASNITNLYFTSGLNVSTQYPINGDAFYQIDGEYYYCMIQNTMFKC